MMYINSCTILEINQQCGISYMDKDHRRWVVPYIKIWEEVHRDSMSYTWDLV